jgi:perosamine synthetase
MKNIIKLFDPMVGKQEELEIKKTLKSHFWASGLGIGNVGKFEKKFNQYIDSKTCLAVNSGTAALHLALSLIDIKNKEVILPSLSFVSTAHAIVMNGGKPIFADIDPKTLCIDPIEVEKKITNKTKVVIPVHFGGMPCEMESIERICSKNKILLVEDAAHGTGASYKGKKIGSHGFAVCFSFHPVKNLAMPSGGAITLNGKNIKKLRNVIESRRWCGISNRKGVDYDVNEVGWNYYMNEFSAAIGLAQLKKLDKLNKKRKKIAKIYFNEINVDKKMPFDENCVYHLYWIRVKKRKQFMEKMKVKGIETGIHYKPIHQMKFYKNNQLLPISDKISKEIVSIPIHPNITDNQIRYIIKSINSLTN